MDDSPLPVLDELRIIAQNGLAYADDPYDEERYERVLEIVAEGYAELGDLSGTEVGELFVDRLGHVTPNVGARAAVVDDEGRLLCIRRSDDGTWGLPGGYAEPGEEPAATAVRETREETGLAVDPVDLVGFYYREADRSNPHGFVGTTYLCTLSGGVMEGSHEVEAIRYLDVDDVPEWHKDHGRVARDAVAAWAERSREAGEE